MATLTEDQLTALTEAIVPVANPRRVVLFGSRARDAAGEDSDVDLLIIEDEPFSPTRSRRREIGRIRRSLPRLGVPIDILLFNSDGVARWRNTTNHVIAQAYEEGRVLHERP